MSAPKRWLCLAVAIGCALPGRAWGQRSANWRVYTAADGLRESYITSVSVSPRGHVWIKYGEADAASWLDGYRVHSLPYSPSLVERNYRLYESRLGQVWTLYSEGVERFDPSNPGRWIKYPLASVQTEFRGGMLRQLRPIPLLPGGRDRLFVLLPDRLLEFNSARNETAVIRRADQTGLGQFLDLTEARDGGVWISGARGLAKVSGPLREWSSAAPWHQYLIDRRLEVQNLQRPMEDDQGDVTLVGETGQGNQRQRVVVFFNGTAWQRFFVPGGKIHAAWRGYDGTFWAHSRDALFHLDPAHPATVETEGGLAGQFLDAAVDPNAKGVFWLATSEGLWRFAPLTWRSPKALRGANTLVHAAVEDPHDRLWFVSANALITSTNGRWERHPFPDSMDLSFQPSDGLYRLPDGRLAIGARDRFVLFDPLTGRFEPVTSPEGWPAEVVGQFKDGALCVQVLDRRRAPGSFRLEQFDQRGFHPFLQPAPGWRLGSELVFVHVAQSGAVWLGGEAGLGVYREGRFERFNSAEGATPNRPLCLLEFADGTIWCGDQGKIAEFDGKTWSIVRAGFEHVNSLALGLDKSVWAATSSGLYRLFKGAWVQNSVEEGLPSAAVYKVFPDRQGRLWAGTARGLCRFYLEADIDPPRTTVREANNQKRIPTDRAVTFIFSGRDKWKFTPTDRLLYSYSLDGAPWTPLDSATTLTFGQLRPGNRRLEVKAMDRNWNEDPTPALYQLAVVVPWYLETRLIIIAFCGLAVALFFAGVAVNRHLRLLRSYAEVERIVAQRTRELEEANRALLHSQKMKALGTLAAGVAHDFNSILSIIKGSAQIIENNLGNREKIRTRLDRIKTVVDQGSGLVKAMLGYSRASTQAPTWCDVNAVVADTLKLLGDRFLHGVTVQVQPAPALPPVLGEKDLIRQMLLNLILNAADAMAGRGQVVVRTGERRRLPEHLVLPPEPANGYVFVEVQDAGTGIAPEILPRIFEPFFTTKAFSSRRGTGLGLSMVYEFAKDLGYGLMVESTVGRGSTFAILMSIKGPPDSFAT